MAVGRHRAQHVDLVRFGGVEIDAVEVIARFLGRDRKAGAVDEALQVGRRHQEIMREVAARHQRIILGRKARQGEGGAPGAERHQPLVAGGLQFDLGAFAQLADDVVERVRRHGGGAGRRALSGERGDHFEIHVGRGERELGALGAQQHVRQDRDGVAPLDDALHMSQSAEQRGAFDGQFHGWRFTLAGGGKPCPGKSGKPRPTRPRTGRENGTKI